MASKWYLKAEGAETGPLSFRELADLVRSQAIAETDLVRPDWKTEWQRADSVIGLFYMARKSPEEAALLDEASLESVSSGSPDSVADPDDAAPAIEVSQPGWMQRLLHVIRLRKPSDANLKNKTGSGDSAKAGPDSQPSELLPEFPSDSNLAPSIAATGSAEWSNAVDAVLARTDARAPDQASITEQQPSPRNSAANRRLATCFQVVMAILSALYVMDAVEKWSAEETALQARRTYLYKRQSETGARGKPADMEQRLRASDGRWPRRYFPYLGEWEGAEYVSLMITLGMSTAVLTYALEKMVELILHGRLFVRRRDLQ
ncbi:MAG: hypothetical protein JWM11_1419 [Planctomycetaceae bacterium]|nr:hypothetical protein [Planctomycetaceae bacterium]